MRYLAIINIRDAINEKNYGKLYDIIAQLNFDINQVGRCDWTPLLVAADLGDKKIVEIFLKMGANPNCVITANEYPSVLAWTIKKANSKKNINQRQDYIAIVDLLLQYGAREMSDRGGRQTALHIAAGYGDQDIASRLIKFGFYPKAMNACGDTPIDIAVLGGHQNLANYLSSCSTDDISLDKIIKAGVIEKSWYERYSHVLDNQMRRTFNLPQEIMDKIKYFSFYRRGKMYNREKGIMGAVKQDINHLRAKFREGYIVNDAYVRDYHDSPLEYASKHNEINMAKLLIKHSSILTDQAYKEAASDEMRELLLNEKRRQLEILKTELDLQDKDPRSCSLC